MQVPKNCPPDESVVFVERQAALEELQRLQRDYGVAEENTNQAHLAFLEAEKELNEAFQNMSELRPEQLRIWNDFESYRSRKLAEIAELRAKIRDMEIEQSQLEHERNRKSTKSSRAIRASIAAIEKKSSEIGANISRCYSELQSEYENARLACDFDEMRIYRDKKNTYVLRRLEYDLAKQHQTSLSASLRIAEESLAKKEQAYSQLIACNKLS